MTLSEARQFLRKHNKAQAMATGTWARIKPLWDEAYSVVEQHKERERQAFFVLARSKEHRLFTDAQKQRLSARMREIFGK